MGDSDLAERYQDLQSYIGWTSEDASRVGAISKLLEPHLDELIDDFYCEIQKHSETAKVITGGQKQIENLKGTLCHWLCDLLGGKYDAAYQSNLWEIGLRHAEIGLPQAYASAALSRLRNSILRIWMATAPVSLKQAHATLESLNKLIDFNGIIIQESYESERLQQTKYVERERGETRFRKLVENAASMVIILRADHTIAYFSPYAEELTGYTAGSVHGKNYFEIFLEEESRLGVAEELKQILAGKKTRGYENQIRCRDGSRRWMLWNAQRIDDYEREAAVLAVGHDITERRQTHEQLMRSERLAGIGQMVAGLAHESRNALQRIQTCVEMLELEIHQNAKALGYVRRLQQAQNDLRRVFDEVRNYAAPISLERSECDLEGIWNEAWRILETSRRDRKAKLCSSSGGLDLRILVDRFLIVQLFRNLFENSLSACSDPVRIEITCRTAEIEGQEGVEIAMCDNGPGLTPEARQNVFDPFFTTKTKGTGLGMAIAQRLVEAHGGRLAVGADRPVGADGLGGAEFVITLPRSAQLPDPAP